MDFTALISIVVALLVLGVVCYCINMIPGLPEPIRRVCMILIILLGCLWLVSRSGLL